MLTHKLVAGPAQLCPHASGRQGKLQMQMTPYSITHMGANENVAFTHAIYEQPDERLNLVRKLPRFLPIKSKSMIGD